MALLVWAAATAWSVGYCAAHGYGQSAEPLTFVLWFPAWVFWGVVAPWLVCIVVSLWYALVLMRDEDLGADEQEDDEALSPAPEHTDG